MKEWTLTAILTGDGGFSDIPEGRCFLDDADEELSERRRDLLLSDVLRISVKKKKRHSALISRKLVVARFSFALRQVSSTADGSLFYDSANFSSEGGASVECLDGVWSSKNVFSAGAPLC